MGIAEFLVRKARWELRSRSEREGEKWSEEWEIEQQESKKVYSEGEHKLTFCKRRVTDIATCRRLTMPMAGPVKEENILANLKGRIIETGLGYINSKCDSRGFPILKSLTRLERNYRSRGPRMGRSSSNLLIRVVACQ